MLGIVVEADDITGPRLQSQSGHGLRLDPPDFGAFAHLLLQTIGKAIPHTMAAGNHAQAARITSEIIEVESDLDVQLIAVPAVGMPAGITGIIVAVAAHVVEVFA